MTLNCIEVATAALGPPRKISSSEAYFNCHGTGHQGGDVHPSLQTNQQKNNWLCGPCSASGNSWQLAAFLAQLSPDDKPGVTAWLRERGLLGDNSSNKKIVATYDYTDATGKVLYEKVRYEPKTFRLRRSDRNGGYIYNLKDTKLVLYNLPAMMEAKSILFVEGEKDVETAKRLNLVATTSGGTNTWRKEFAEYFRGKRVAILPDPDDAGREHARKVAADLIGVAEIVKLVKILGDDLSDWAIEGSDLRDQRALLTLIRATGELTAEEVAGWTVPKDQADQGRETEGAPEKGSPLTVEGMLEQAGLSGLKKGVSMEEVEQALRKLAVYAGGVDPLRRAALRSTAVTHLTGAGVSAPTKLIDAALKEPPGEAGDGPGQGVLFEDPEPWPDPVGGDQLLCEISSLFKRFVVLQTGGLTALSLWVVHSVALDAANISPILAILSPEKRCGKTILLEILFNLVRRPLTAANITAAAIFRSIEKWTPTLLIDEADSFLIGNDELRGVINSGYRRNMAKIVRTVGDEHEPKVFSTWGPKAIAQIGKLPATLEDRAIVIQMKRKAPGERVERFRPEKISAELEVVRRKAARWVADNLEALREATPQTPDGLHDRAADNWDPLLAIAAAAGGDWPDSAGRDALLLSGPDSTEENSAGTQLLADLKELFKKKEQQSLVASEEIVEYLTGLEDRPWVEWKKGRPITKHQLASLLRKFGVRAKQRRLGGDPVRGYEIADFEDSFDRYLPSNAVHAVQAHGINSLGEVSGSVQSGVRTDLEMHPKPMITKPCTGRTDLEPPCGDKSGQQALPAGENTLPLEPEGSPSWDAAEENQEPENAPAEIPEAEPDWEEL